MLSLLLIFVLEVGLVFSLQTSARFRVCYETVILYGPVILYGGGRMRPRGEGGSSG